ncbi:Rad21/Rec8 N terminal domain protein [Aspergillus undulatus]|uniref:Rad21/Rec8 N terminal domain protein n=1 Tax=Aspergillus undulatus TaxID=1810928 RepID=UPI003CCDF9E8
MHDKMRQMLRSMPAGGLDPTAGKARPDQLVLPYDPSFLPENNLPGLGIDLLKLNRLLEVDASQQSSVFMPQTPDLSQSALSSSSALRLNIPSDDNILRDTGGFSSEPDMASSAQGGVGFGRLLASSLNEDAGVLLHPDFEFDEDGNIIELGVRNQREGVRPASGARGNGTNEFTFDEQPLLADEDIEMAITNEPARPTGPAVFSNPVDQPAPGPADTERNEVTAPQRQRAPKILPTDGQTALRNAELAHMNDGYLHNMAVAAKQKRNNKVPTQAKKNAAYWVFGMGIGCVGAGVGTSRVIHPLHVFSGVELYETLVTMGAGRKRPLDDDSDSEARRVRARDEDDEHLGRVKLVDDNDFWNQDIELGRHASPPLQDDNSSQMPWNITASVQSSRHDPSASNIFRGFGSVSDFSTRGFPESAGSFGRDAIGLGRTRSRLTSASPLAGRGFPYDIDNLSVLGHADDDLNNLGDLDLSHYLDGEDIAMGGGDSNSIAAAGPAYTSQQALQNSLTESVMDQEGLNFLDFLAAKIQSLKTTDAEDEETANPGTGDAGAPTGKEITFATLLPPHKTSPVVATQGLMHILALTTKGFLRVRQDAYQDQSTQELGVKYEYGDIFVRLAEI